MSPPADLLWRVNNEYRKRLSQLATYLSLLEQLVVTRNGDSAAQTIALLRFMQDQVDALVEEHRQWRHRYYYESLDTRRMVQSDNEVHQALARFSRMRGQHEQRLAEMNNLIQQIQRPDPSLTRIPTGDLWELAGFALNDLNGFNDFVRQFAGVS